MGTCSPCPAGPRALSPASTSWAPGPPAQVFRITSLRGLLCYTFTLFFDYRSLLCAVTVDPDHGLAGVSTSRWLPLPQAWVCSPRQLLVELVFMDSAGVGPLELGLCPLPESGGLCLCRCRGLSFPEPWRQGDLFLRLRLSVLPESDLQNVNLFILIPFHLCSTVTFYWLPFENSTN